MIDFSQQLSPHFTLGEMVRTAHRYIDNKPTPDEIDRLTHLCTYFLEPVRAQFGPLWVTSGFRCEKLNAAIGGSKVSAHMYGCAADFVAMGAGVQLTSKSIVGWIVAHSGLPFDQVIDEYSSMANWIHLGIVRPVGNQTPWRQALTMRDGKYSTFDIGEPNA